MLASRHLAPVALAVWLGGAADAQVGPYELVNSSVGHQQRGIAAADFDSDGDLDLVTNSLRDDRVVLYLADGAGGYAEGRELSREATGSAPVRAVDLDGDGPVDLVLSTYDAVQWMRGRGDGTFEEPAALLTGLNGFEELWVLDADADGALDVAFSDPYRVWIAFGGAAGQLSAPVSALYSPGGDLQTTAVVDLDGDGLADVVGATPYESIWTPPLDGEVRHARQTAPRVFSAPAVVSSGLILSSGLWAYDADLDGDLDLLRSDANSADLVFYRNLGGSTFDSTPTTLVSLPQLSYLHLADLEGDGDVDMVAARGSGLVRTIEELLIVGPETLVTGASMTGDGAYRIERADVDGDGRLDLLTLTSPDRLLWHRAEPTGGYAAPREVTDRLVRGSVDRQFAVADLDGDGGLDIVVQGEEVRTVEQRADGSFGRSAATGAPRSTFRFPELVDMDGDGDLDLLNARWTPVNFDYELSWVPRVAGGFGAPVIIGTFPSTLDLQSPVGIDWDEDGDVDVFATSYTAGELRVFEGLGGGALAPDVAVGALSNAAMSSPVDVDGDGALDLVLSSLNLPGTRTFVRRNQRDGTLGPLVEVGSLTARVRNVAFVDLDGDGDRDALRVEETGSSGADVLLYENRGAAGFAPRGVVISDPLVGQYMQLHGVDWDLDGRQDVVVSHRSRRRVSWYPGLGGLQLGPEEILTDDTDEADGLCIVDLDGDLDPDLVLADGDIQALRSFDNLRELGQPLCQGLPNSTGQPAGLRVTGSDVAGLDRTALTALDLPPASFGYFVASRQAAPTPVPVQDGLLCLGGAVSRYARPGEIGNSGPSGSFSLTLNLADTPTPTGSVTVLAGETWHYQAWYRDANPSPTSNLTQAVSVTYR